MLSGNNAIKRGVIDCQPFFKGQMVNFVLFCYFA